MNIALMGCRGTGKTTICRLLARSMNKKLISTDEEILKMTKMPVEKFLKKYGWNKLRDIESDVIDSVSELDECVFDINGDIVMRNENVISLKKNSLIVVLTADAKTIARRLKRTEKFPLDKYDFTDDMKELCEERELRHNKAADYAIDTSSMAPEEVCDLITHYIQMELQ